MGQPVVNQGNSSVEYTHQNPESLLSKLLKWIFRLSGWKTSIEREFTKDRFDQEAAAIPGSILKNIQINMDEIDKRRIWTLVPLSGGSGQVILYLHGGAYIHNIQKVHWQFIDKLIRRTAATVVVPDYPLAPQADCLKVFEFMGKVHGLLRERYEPEQMIFMGDSAGAGLALSFCQHLRDRGEALPHRLLLLSPWLDVGMGDPQLEALDRHDQMLGIQGLQMAGKSYAGPLDLKDYRVSPLYGDLTGLPKISLFTGTHDLLYADAERLRSRLAEEGIPINYFEYPRMLHVWFLMPYLFEAERSLGQMVEIIQEK